MPATCSHAVREQFIGLQAAWDAADLGTLGALTTPQMLDEICAQIPPAGSPPNRTDVLAARRGCSASTISIGLARDDRVQRPDPRITRARGDPFRELWLLMRERQPHAGRTRRRCTPWRLARQQALL